MKFLREHWYDLAGLLALLSVLFLIFSYSLLSSYQILLWLSLISLFLHQMEEYRIIGTFPGMVNKIMFKSDKPDRYPLNTQSAVFVNVFMGWTTYFLAIVFAEKAIWLGMATILISVGNIFAHCFIFNIKGKTFYNAGIATSIILFLPITILFFYIIFTDQLVQPIDYLIGIPLGILLNYVGVIKMIMWLKDENTRYQFPKRSLLEGNKISNL